MFDGTDALWESEIDTYPRVDAGCISVQTIFRQLSNYQEEVAGMRILLVSMNERLLHMQQSNPAGVVKPKSLWMCPVCDGEYTTMRTCPIS